MIPPCSDGANDASDGLVPLVSLTSSGRASTLVFLCPIGGISDVTKEKKTNIYTSFKVSTFIFSVYNDFAHPNDLWKFDCNWAIIVADI